MTIFRYLNKYVSFLNCTMGLQFKDIHFVKRSELSIFGKFAPLSYGYILYKDSFKEVGVSFTLDRIYLNIHSLVYNSETHLRETINFISKIARYRKRIVRIKPVGSLPESLKPFFKHTYWGVWMLSEYPDLKTYSLPLEPSSVPNRSFYLNLHLPEDYFEPENDLDGIVFEYADDSENDLKNIGLGDIITGNELEYIVGGIKQPDKNSSLLKLYLLPLPPYQEPSPYD